MSVMANQTLSRRKTRRDRNEDVDGLLEAVGVPKVALGGMAGMSKQSAYNFADGQKDCLTDSLDAIAKALGVPIERVLLAFRATREKAGQ